MLTVHRFKYLGADGELNEILGDPALHTGTPSDKISILADTLALEDRNCKFW